MPLEKPSSVSADPFKSAKWDELTAGREFAQSDAPTLALLCQWHQVVAQCMDDLDYGGEIRVAYENKMGDVKAFPQLATMKQASAEIRALNKQLGINDEAAPAAPKRGAVIHVIQGKRLARAEGGRGARAV